MDVDDVECSVCYTERSNHPAEADAIIGEQVSPENDLGGMSCDADLEPGSASSAGASY